MKERFEYIKNTMVKQIILVIKKKEKYANKN